MLPLPRIDDTINKIAKYKVFSIDLRSAYHRISITEADKPFTAFESDQGLYQFTRIPFGVTNGVACFQRKMEEFIKEEEVDDTFAFMDIVTICGMNQDEHDFNLAEFRKAARKRHLTLNEAKFVYSVTSLNILGYHIENGDVKPDPERLRPLKEIPLPHASKSLKRVIGLF